MTQIPAGWEETTLGKKIFIQPWFAFKSSDFEWISNSFVVKIKNIQPPFVVLNSNDTVNILNYSHEKLEKFVVKRGDYLVAMTWETIWKVGKYLLDFDSYLNQRVCKFVDMQKADYKFIYYTLLNSSFQKYINAFSFGAAQANISTTEIWNFQIHLPPLPEQQAIAAVLSSFDDKIELLRAENQTLEQMGQELFKERFGKWKVGDDLPEGWRVYRLNELVEIVNGYSYKGNELLESGEDALVTLKSFDRNWGFQTRWFKPFNWNPKKNQEVNIWDLVVPHTDLTQDGDVLWNPALIFDNGGFQKMYITMDLVKVVSRVPEINSAFLYYLMKTKEFKGHCLGYANGTTVLHLSKKAIPEYKIVLPKNLEKIKSISNVLEKFTLKISKNTKAIQTLSTTRDLLLPKLMSGEVRVEF